jgi:hypothetical protein
MLFVTEKFHKKKTTTTLFCPTTDAETKGIVDEIKNIKVNAQMD